MIVSAFKLFIVCIPLWVMSCSSSPKSKRTVDNVSIGEIVVEPRKCDFGQVSAKKQEVVVCIAKIKNESDRIINISKIDVSCGCMKAYLQSDRLTAGDSTVVSIEINTKKQRGYFNKVIYINSNAANSLVLLRVKGEILD